ncbi:NAD-dependent epimerase/dehydratase family protein [Mesorhizobium sp. ES1-4]|uniref:NAD-dependent epimerase/dehydratase family protein n=1 Tax=Mesorhizobium sp. ES1-4 TaxID=2876627 RepID=UPI001CCC90A6|nr:NAD(P)-dependent oxidoreductase [Mesorhizobium sp. ES1-4]MBZ9799857.1 NAD(P)-dependent oxidoreductase [Mesorhizobium sp. ES1-4]
MKALVTGSSGFVGQALCRSLVEQGHDVLALDAMKRDDDRLTVVCDLLDSPKLQGLAEEFRATKIVHCGGVSGPMLLVDQPSLISDINVKGTVNLLEIARKTGADRFIFCSSIAVYGGAYTVNPVPENVPLFPTTVYAATKVAAEALVTAYAVSFGLSATSLRIGKVFGPSRATACEMRTLISDALEGRSTLLTAPPSYLHHYIYIDDVVMAIERAMTANAEFNPAYNIVSPEDPSLDQIVEFLRDELPSANIHFACDASISAERIPTLSCQAASRDLNFQAPTAIREGVRRYASHIARCRHDGSARTSR